MKQIIKQLLPGKLIFKLMQYKNIAKLKFHENKIGDIERDKLEMISQMNPKPVLFAGYPKSGNTWLRFLIFNYFNVAINKAEETLTYNQLNNNFQNDEIGYLKDRVPEIKGSPDGFPHLIRTESHFKEPYKVFDRIIYISRNPLDVLVSAYHFFIKNRENDKGISYPFNNIDSYVLFYLPFWIHHVKSYYQRNDVLHITYEELKENSVDGLERVLHYLEYNSLDKGAMLASSEFSSFTSIKKMGREKGETHGMGPKGSYKGEFTRKGKVGGYQEELEEETILEAKKILAKHNLAGKLKVETD